MALSLAAGLRTQYERTEVAGFGEKSGVAKQAESGIIKANSSISPAEKHTSIDKVWNVDPSGKAHISKAVEEFASSFSTAEKEHSIVITPSGKAFLLTGTDVTVDPSVIGGEKLRGSIGAHNHPVPNGEEMGDSFSRADLLFSAKYKTGIEYLVSGKRRNAFEFLREYTEEEIYHAWDKALQTVRSRAFSGELIIDWEQEEILKVLSEQLEGFVFYEDF